MTFPALQNCTVAVIGLGYVGLPLALAFAERKICFKTKNSLNRNIIGFDINNVRINQLNEGVDNTNEVEKEKLKNLSLIKFTSDLEKIALADVFIITVPTPIKDGNTPDLLPLRNASTTVGQALKFREDINKKDKRKMSNPFVIYESTVYPGCTEEVCIPILEKESNLTSNKGFFYGYSPERINPGDINHKLKDIQKITSGGNQESGSWINNFYGSIIEAGTHLTKSIKIAETAKVIENTQRDLNIALVNELAIICNLLNINTIEVLEAAGTKWNFHSYRPGLVGGHCIGVDPYYLTYKAQQIGYLPEVVLAGRRINNSMGDRIVDIFIKEFFKKEKDIKDSNVLILGLTFKENCSDIRNTKVINIINKLKDYNPNITIVDPLADIEKTEFYYRIKIKNKIPIKNKFDGIIVAVGHEQFKRFESDYWQSLMKKDCIIMDIKNIVPEEINSIKI